MMNSFFANLFGAKNTVVMPIQIVSEKKHTELYDTYFKYYTEREYSEEDADLIASLFEDSAMAAEPVGSYSLNEMRSKGRLSLYLFGGNGTQLCCHNKEGKIVEVHMVSLESAIFLHEQEVVYFERSSRHSLEYFGLL
jgi:hypothetical protein